MRSAAAPLPLVVARLRRRPTRWVLPCVGIAVAAAFAAAVAAESVVTGDLGARSALAELSALDRSVRITWDGPLTSGVERTARGLLSRLGLAMQTEVVLLNPVRLDGVVVRPAAVAPLDRWLGGRPAARLAGCHPVSCPVLDASPARVPAMLSTTAARLHVVGAAPLYSAVPLTFSPLAGGGPPVLVTGDAAGLAGLPGLSGVYRTYSWTAPLAVARLHSWQLRALEDRLARAEAAVGAAGSQFTLSAPFDGLDRARAEADAAPRRLLLVAGGATALLALFVILAGAGLRRDQSAELDRLRAAGARSWQCAVFVLAESAWLCAAALTVGGAAGIAAASIVATSSAEPVGGILAHSLLTPAGGIALAGAWAAGVTLMSLPLLVPGSGVVDAAALVSIAALGVALAIGPGGSGAEAILVAPLCCVAAGVVIYRAASALLRAGERLSSYGAIRVRLALVGLARAPALPSAAIAFIAVSVGLGGFALAYHATLLRSAADQAADRVPLDATVSPGPDFARPLELAPLGRWRKLSGGDVFPVRRTEANYASGGATVTVPALGVPAAGLALIHGWRASDGSASLTGLADRLRPAGALRIPGPTLPTGAESLSVRGASPGGAAVVTAELRDPQGSVTPLRLGVAGAIPGLLRARLPAGRWELEALELAIPTGLEATNGHQNAENPTGAAQQQTVVRLGPARVYSASGRALATVALGAWRAVGAAAPALPAGADPTLSVLFDATGQPGVVRPAQPSDTRPLPVLADPQTAAASGPRGRLAITVDGLPVIARVVGELRRFPSLPADAPGFVIADEPALAAALDAELPGQGRADELWIAGGHEGTLRAALAQPPFTQLSPSFRSDLERQARSAPLARGVLRTLVAASTVAAVLAVLGLIAAFLGPARDLVVERDLEAQGIGPSGLRADLRLRIALASGAAVAAGVVVAALLVRVAVAAVRAATTVADPRPPLVTVLPWAQLAAWGAGTTVVLVLCGSLAVRVLR